MDTLYERVQLLTNPRPSQSGQYQEAANTFQGPSIMEQLPNEVLLHIFSFLDDVSLYAVGNTCRRWYALQARGRGHWQVKRHQQPLALVILVTILEPCSYRHTLGGGGRYTVPSAKYMTGSLLTLCWWSPLSA